MTPEQVKHVLECDAAYQAELERVWGPVMATMARFNREASGATPALAAARDAYYAALRWE